MSAVESHHYEIDERQALFNAGTAITRLAMKAKRHPMTRAILLVKARELRTAAVCLLDDKEEPMKTETQIIAEQAALFVLENHAAGIPAAERDRLAEEIGLRVAANLDTT